LPFLKLQPPRKFEGFTSVPIVYRYRLRAPQIGHKNVGTAVQAHSCLIRITHWVITLKLHNNSGDPSRSRDGNRPKPT